jgi:hypothetical protein
MIRKFVFGLSKAIVSLCTISLSAIQRRMLMTILELTDNYKCVERSGANPSGNDEQIIIAPFLNQLHSCEKAKYNE